MIHAALTFWYALATLFGPSLCCAFCCRPAAVVAATETAPLEAKPCGHCCEAPAPLPQPAQKSPCQPQKPACPICEAMTAAAQATLQTPSAMPGDLLDNPASFLDSTLVPQSVSLATVGVLAKNAGPPAPFPTAYDLVCVFHFMRC